MEIRETTDSTYDISNKSTQVAAKGKLSDTAKSYLDGLKQKYSNVNITVNDFSSEKQSDTYMYGSSGYNNVAISKNILEKMAANPDAAAEYEKVISEMPEHAKNIEEFAKNNNQIIYGSGVVIDKNGKVSYWMIGGDKEARENPGAIYKENIKKQIEELRAKKKEEESIIEKKLIKTEAKEKLLEKIKENKMDLRTSLLQIKQEDNTDQRMKDKGEYIDLSI